MWIKFIYKYNLYYNFLSLKMKATFISIHKKLKYKKIINFWFIYFLYLFVTFYQNNYAALLAANYVY